jgi:hypothetical protein
VLELYHTIIPKVARREMHFGVDHGHSVMVVWEKSLSLVLRRAGQVSRKDLWICSWDSSRESKSFSNSQI